MKNNLDPNSEWKKRFPCDGWHSRFFTKTWADRKPSRGAIADTTRQQLDCVGPRDTIQSCCPLKTSGRMNSNFRILFPLAAKSVKSSRFMRKLYVFPWKENDQGCSGVGKLPSWIHNNVEHFLNFKKSKKYTFLIYWLRVILTLTLCDGMFKSFTADSKNHGL